VPVDAIGFPISSEQTETLRVAFGGRGLAHGWRHGTIRRTCELEWRLAQPRGSALGQLDGMYFVRSAQGAQLVGIQGIGTGRVVAFDLGPRLDAVARMHVLESDPPLFDGPTTGAVVGSQLYFIANSQLWAPRPPRETFILKVALDASTGSR
jgi:hypothetical protein